MSARRTRPARWVGALLAVWGAAALIAAPAQAQAQSDFSAEAASTAATVSFDIPAQDLGEALADFARQSGQEMLYAPSAVVGKTSTAINGRLSRPAAMQQLLDGTGLLFEIHESGSMIIGDEEGIAAYRERMQTSDASGAVQATTPAPAATPAPITNIDTARRAGVEEIIVTGQKKEERLQDVPIAISAFSMESLDAQKIEGGFDLLKAVPNVTFSKTNFSGYNFQIRGIGTQAISATTDPGVAVSYNNTTLIVNRLFEQEYLDIERVEVLRGPQGTLYGRNANAGVINVIPARPEIGAASGELRLETGNYSAQRIRGHYNLPLNSDSLALRLAYASTVRDGYVTNEFDNSPIDGRDLSTTRLSLGWEPTDRIRVDFSWERFKEDDDRLRSAKNLCHRDDGRDKIGSLVVDTAQQPQAIRRTVQQGCLPGSLYSGGAFDTPNGDAAPFITIGRANDALELFFISGSVAPFPQAPITTFTNVDVFSEDRQSTDLRSVYSPIDPVYKAASDLFDLTLSYQWGDALTLTSYTVFNDDELFSTQDFTRYAATPGLFSDIGGDDVLPQYANFSPNGLFCDPQLGCNNAFQAQDVSQSESRQFNQQFELVSDFDGIWNFSLGANFTRFETTVDYFFFSNALTALAQTAPFDGQFHPCTTEGRGCVSIQSDDLLTTVANPYGHNFFLSRNPYLLNSAGIFGESYWQITPSLKLTAGLRFTWDRKQFTPTPSQTLLADYREAVLIAEPSSDDPETGPEGCTAGLCVSLGNAPGGRGYPTDPNIVQTWREPTGRVILDWSPQLPFADETLVYLSYARGYKGGGANPPSIAPPAGNFVRLAQGAVSSPTFDPEYVNAYEIGMKNTLLDGAVMLNTTAFYYDYEGYQVSKIVDRSASNENFDAKIWGAELELIVAPTPDWLNNITLGFLRTQIADGEKSIDLIDRTQGGNQFHITGLLNPNYDPTVAPVAIEDYEAGVEIIDADGNARPIQAGQEFLAFDEWVVVKPNAAQSSNCVAPADIVALTVGPSGGISANAPFGVVQAVSSFCAAGNLLGASNLPLGYRAEYAPNAGAGFLADVSGNDLPNAPRFTLALGSQYTIRPSPAWELTGRIDWYWQDRSFARVYNTEYDRLKAWSNTNLSLWLEQPDWGLRLEAYVKNAFDETPITGSFLNSDDTGLTTNIFTLDPRLVGVSITKSF